MPTGVAGAVERAPRAGLLSASAWAIIRSAMRCGSAHPAAPTGRCQLNPDSCFSNPGGSRRQRVTLLFQLRFLVLIVASGAATGCAHDVVLQDPHTGATEVCRGSLAGFNPWSQKMACVSDHIALGWTTRIDQK